MSWQYQDPKFERWGQMFRRQVNCPFHFHFRGHTELVQDKEGAMPEYNHDEDTSHHLLHCRHGHQWMAHPKIQ